MHIGFDISQTGSGKAGCGYVAHAMISSLVEIAPQHEYSTYPSFGDFYFDPRMPMRSPYQGPRLHYGPRHLTRESAAAFWSDDRVEQALGEPDVVHSNNFWCPVQFRSTRLVYTLHDLGFLVNPEWTTETNRLGCFDGAFRSSIAADWIVAVSAASREHYLDLFPHFPASRVRVIHPCSRFVDSNQAGTRPPALAGLESDRFWLTVGTVEPRKNHRRLAEAYARYRSGSVEPMPLVVAGGKGWLMDDFVRQLQDLAIADHVHITGYVTDDELVWLYRNCYANLFPSLFEGFGLPVLEGMQFGAATISSNTTSLTEVGGDAAIFLPPDHIEAWAEAMLALSADPTERARRRSRSIEQAATFDWHASARQLLQLYEEAVASPKRTEGLR